MSRQDEQVRYFQAMASSVRRCSAHRRPRTGWAGIRGSIRSHIASVITNRTDTSDQLAYRPKRHAPARSSRGFSGRSGRMWRNLCELRHDSLTIESDGTLTRLILWESCEWSERREVDTGDRGAYAGATKRSLSVSGGCDRVVDVVGAARVAGGVGDCSSSRDGCGV